MSDIQCNKNLSQELNKADIVTTNLAVDYESLEQHPDHPGQKGLLVVVQALNHVALDPQSSIKEVWVTVHDINEPPRLLSRQPGALHVYENLRNEQVSGNFSIFFFIKLYCQEVASKAKTLKKTKLDSQ